LASEENKQKAAEIVSRVWVQAQDQELLKEIISEALEAAYEQGVDTATGACDDQMCYLSHQSTKMKFRLFRDFLPRYLAGADQPIEHAVRSALVDARVAFAHFEASIRDEEGTV